MKFNKVLSFILMILILYYMIKIINLKIPKKNDKYKIKIKYLNNKNDIFYKKMLQLYIDNREKFYLKGRKFKMKLYGSSFDESNIITIQDKLNYLLVYDFPENKSRYVDKILLREYSKEILGKDICVPILKIYNNTDEIDINELPQKFILKCNHGSAMNIVCKNKALFNLNHAKQILKNWMNINYGLLGFEYQYLNVKRKIFAEKYLTDDIIDYKINCFNGEPKFIRVKKHINGANVNNIYDLNWTLTDLDFNYSDFVRNASINFSKPINFEKMLKYARLLSSRFIFCRVDFYEVNKTIYLGELTFAPANIKMKYNNRKTSIYLGSLLNISQIQKRKNS